MENRRSSPDTHLITHSFSCFATCKAIDEAWVFSYFLPFLFFVFRILSSTSVLFTAILTFEL